MKKLKNWLGACKFVNFEEIKKVPAKTDIPLCLSAFVAKIRISS
jgi:hypothetical protein